MYMMRQHPVHEPQLVDSDWVTFPGGELDGKRPKARCQACRAAERLRSGSPAPICFQCYRASLDRERALKAAGQLDTGSDERFQAALPLEPVNRWRLDMLRAERAAERAARQSGVDRSVAKRRQAQIAARHALQRIAAGLPEHRIPISAIHAAELQLPEAWLPFVVSR
jgi:hypothetical protein